MNRQHTDTVSTVGFRHDEPVISTHPVLDGAGIPAFGDTAVWDFNGVLRRPANLAAAHWKLCFSKELTDPFWNLLARELCMIELNPRHPVLIAAGLSRTPSPTALTTLTQVLTCVRRLARWSRTHQAPPLVTWHEQRLRQFVTDLKAELAASTVGHYVALLKALHTFQRVLSCGGVRLDPWQGKSTCQVAEAAPTPAVSTPVLPPQQWFPLIRAAWTYVHVFAPDLLRARERYTDLAAHAVQTSKGVDDRLADWLRDPARYIPVHPPTRSGHPLAVPEPNYTLFALLLGVNLAASGSVFKHTRPGARGRREAVQRAVAAGHPTMIGAIDGLAQVTRPDGTTGPWHMGLDPDAVRRELSFLRDAAFTLVVGLSMMRDSEIHEITKGSVVEYFGTPAIVSTRQKHDPNLPTKHWWITAPVAEAIAVAEHLSSHPERLFVPLDRGPAGARAPSVEMLDSFIAHVNATRTWTGLEEIPPGKVRSHMFRRTMAMLTDQFAGSEIALGMQLKHVATRALANHVTQGYAAADVAWADHLTTAIEAARFRRVEDLYQTHQAGEPIGYGPAAERMTREFDHIRQTVQARSGDAAVERALLRKTRISIRFGTLNHCAFDDTNPAGAVCLENTIVPPGHNGPLQDRCRPDRCANSVIAPEHVPIWNAEKHTLLTLIGAPGLATCRKAALERELIDVETVLRKADKERP